MGYHWLNWKCHLTSLNYFGVKPAAIMQTVFTIFIVGVGLLLVFGAGFNGNFNNLKPFENGVSGTMSVLMMIPFLFVGFDVIPQIAEEVKAPAKKIGGILILSIIASVIFICSLFWCGNRLITQSFKQQ